MKKEGGHSGGSWKVAYADFITTMMALFLVLWLTAQDQKVKEAIERAFRQPFFSVTKQSVGVIPSDNAQALRTDSGNFDSASAIELAMLRRLNEDLMNSLQGEEQDQQSDSIDLDLSPEGLRISVFDRSRKPIFQSESARFTAYGEWVFSTLAWQISRYHTFQVELEGHTERKFRLEQKDYGNWELSTDRANAARRILIQHGLIDSQIRKVAGFADTMPMPNHPPESEANRRVTVLLRATSGSASST